MKRWLLIFLLSLSIVGNLPFSSSESIIVDDEWAYLEVDPHTIGSSGWVEFTLISKRFSGDIDVVWGFNVQEAKPSRPQIWKNYTHTIWEWGDANGTDELVLYDILAYEAIPIEEFLNQTDRIGNEWNTEFYRVNCTFYKEEDFEEFGEKYVGLFEKSGNLTELHIKYYYTTTVKKYFQKAFFDWKPWVVDFQVIKYNYSDMDTWYLLRSVPVEVGKEYRVRTWVEIPWAGLSELKGKYCWGMKLSSDSIRDAIDFGRFYFIDPWWHSSWNTVNKLTFNNSASAEDLVNFPVLINLTSSNFDWTKVQSDGDDIRFLDSDNNTQLSYELEYWNYSGQEAQIWVNVPQIDLGSTTDHIFLYYGNYLASSGEDVTGTWNSNYVMVQHLQESSGTIYDSTANSNDGTASPTTFGQDKWVSGLRGNTLDFDGSNDYIDCGSDSSLNITNEITLEAWIKINNFESLDGIMGKWKAIGNERSYYISLYGTNRVIFWLSTDGTNYNSTDVMNTASTGVWYHIIGIYNTTHLVTYLNSSLQNTYPQTGTIFSNPTQPVLIGSEVNRRYFDGLIEDIRIYNRAINSTEISYSYNSGAGNDPLNTTGLVGWWKLDESGLTENATDSSGSGNHGTLYGYPPEYTSSGQIDGATDFDGNEDKISLGNPSSLQLENSGTISAFVYPIENDVINLIYTSTSGADVDKTPYFRTQSGQLMAYLGNGTAYQSISSGLALTKEIHSFVVLTWNGTVVRIYRNSDVYNVAQTINVSFTGTGYNIGYYITSNPRAFDGYVDECRISNTSRSADWIEAQYLSMTDQFITFGTTTTHTEKAGVGASPRYDWPLIYSEVCDKIPTIPQFIYNKYTPRFVVSVDNNRRSSTYLKANIEITNHDELIYKISEDIILYPQSKDEFTFKLPLYFSRGHIDFNRDPLKFNLKFSIMRMNSEPIITDFEIKPPRFYATLRSMLVILTAIIAIYLIYDFTS